MIVTGVALIVAVATVIRFERRWAHEADAAKRIETSRRPRTAHPSPIAFSIPCLDNAPENDLYAARWLEFSSQSWTAREEYPRPRGAR